MQEKISEDQKIERLTRLQGLQRGITLRKNKNLVGKNVEVLVEGTSKKGQQLTGRTETNKVVNFISDNACINTLINVKIKRASFNALSGELT